MSDFVEKPKDRFSRDAAHFVSADTNATALPDGANCTSFNECGAEGICLQCPGDLNGKCYRCKFNLYVI